MVTLILLVVNVRLLPLNLLISATKFFVERLAVRDFGELLDIAGTVYYVLLTGRVSEINLAVLSVSIFLHQYVFF